MKNECGGAKMKKELKIKGYTATYEAVAKPIGNGAYIMVPKKYTGKKVVVVVK